MIQLNQNQSLERPIYERPFEERKLHGDRAEDCFNEYLKSKYSQSEITYRQKEKEVDYKLPDFAIRPVDKDAFEIEIKTTSKIKIDNFNYQYQYAVKNNLLIFFTQVQIIDNKKIIYRPIEIRKLLNYRVFDKDGVYNDTIPKPYFIVNWNLRYPNDFGFGFFELPQDFVIS